MSTARTGRRDLQLILDRLNDLLMRRDLAIVEEFTEDAILAGSDAGDFARGRAAIAEHFGVVFSMPYVLHFDWKLIEGEADWLFADGEAVIVDGGREQRVPYQLSGAFRRVGDRWRWALFHGSEPRP